MESIVDHKISPNNIMKIGMGFWASKTLLTAVNMSLFTHLANNPMSGKDIKEALGLNERSLYDFLDTLVALGFINRKGMKEKAIYNNTRETDLFLDKNKPSYIGGILEMSNNRLYPFWNHLEEGLKTGQPQNETKNGGAPIFEAIYANQDSLRAFLNAMGGVQMGNFIMLAETFNFSNYNTICDIGGSGANLSIQLANHHHHLNCISFDLPPVTPVATENITHMGLANRVTAISGDFFVDDFPKADIITMGNILHDWGKEDKLMLITKAFSALPKGGALIVIENIIDDDRRHNAFGLMMSLNMAIETEEGFDFTASDFDEWAKQVGFESTKVIPLAGPSSAVVAIK